MPTTVSGRQFLDRKDRREFLIRQDLAIRPKPPNKNINFVALLTHKSGSHSEQALAVQYRINFSLKMTRFRGLRVGRGGIVELLSGPDSLKGVPTSNKPYAPWALRSPHRPIQSCGNSRSISFVEILHALNTLSKLVDNST